MCKFTAKPFLLVFGELLKDTRENSHKIHRKDLREICKYIWLQSWSNDELGKLSPNCDYPNVCPDALGDATMITSLIFYWCNLGFGQAINYFYISQMYEPNAWCHNLGGPFFRQTRVSMKLSFCRRNSFSLILEHWIQSLALIVSCFYGKVESSPHVVFWRVTLSQASFRRGVNYPRISDTSP